VRIAYDVTPLSHPRTGVGNYILGALQGMVEAGGQELVAFGPVSIRGRPLLDAALDGIDVERRLVTVPFAHATRRLWGALDEETWKLAGRAAQIVEWDRNHRFCGRCGTPTVDAPGERARACPECGLLAYPRLAPAVIMLVERDDGRALLARNANFPAGMFSCLAGFVEPGETLEHAVRREVMEEVGLAVGDVEFRGSQPWPFPHQVMIGFGARYVSGDIAIDGTEIVEAQWFTRDDTPNFPTGGMSIAGRLIDEWRARGV